jgi:hypothetical protein
MAPSGMRGVLNDAVSIYFPDAALAAAFVARWCIGYMVETAEGAFRVREDEPTPRIEAGLHRTSRGRTGSGLRRSALFPARISAERGLADRG